MERRRVTFIVATVMVAALALAQHETGGQAARVRLADGVAIQESIGAIAQAPDGSIILASTDRTSLRRLSRNGAISARVRNIAGAVPGALAADDQRMYLVNLGTLQIADGKTGDEIRRFPVPDDASVATLPGGRIVVAGHSHGKRLQVYNHFGARQREFGELVSFHANAQQNEFLNRGLVATYQERIVFAYSTALDSVVEVWTAEGELLTHFRVNSDTLDRQRRAAEQILASVGEGVGGQILIMALAADRRSGNIWIAANAGSAETALQEYSQAGALIAEFQLGMGGPSAVSGLIKGLVVDGPLITALTGDALVQWRIPSSPQ